VLRENRERANDAERWRCDEIARGLPAELRTTNPRFDRERFLRASGMEG
jgi:hypothetical protein